MIIRHQLSDCCIQLCDSTVLIKTLIGCMNLDLGRVRQYRLFRMHVNFGTNSKLYPYDSQKPSIKLQSLDYGEDTIHMTVKEGSPNQALNRRQRCQGSSIDSRYNNEFAIL